MKTELGRYRLSKKLGAGGMGEVWQAEDPDLGREVAVKLLRAGVTAGRERLGREARAMARLAHPNVITVHDVGDEGGQLFIAMELIDGGTLRTWMEAGGGRRGWREVVERMVAAGRGLAAAHQAGLVHRDFKPDNVLLRQDGRVVVSDFGLARLEGTGAGAGAGAGAGPETETVPDDAADREVSPARDLATITAEGKLLGTPVYMAPEQHLGRPATAASDQFAFCVTLWEALYGQRPFGPSSGEGIQPAAAIGLAIIDGKLRTPPRDVRVPGWLRRIVGRGLRVEPGERFASMAAVVGAMERGLGRRRRMVAGAAAAVAIGAGAMVALWPRAAAGPSCDAVGRELAGAWDDARRGELRAAFAADGRPHVGATADNVVTALDGYAGEWVAMRGEACRATVEGRQTGELLDLRNACLDQRRSALDALVDALAAAPGPEVVDRALDAARGLPALASCSDADALRAAVPLPTDPVKRREVEELRARLAAVEALRLVGRHADAHALAAPLADDAGKVGFAPAQVEALAMRGNLESSLARFEAARATLEETLRLGADIHEDDLAAGVAIELMYVVGNGLGKVDEALAMRPLVESLLRRAGDPVRRRVTFLQNAAGLLMEAGDLEGAQAALEDALARTERELGPEDVKVAETLENLAVIAQIQGRFDASKVLRQRQLDIVQARYGPDHPAVANALHGAAQTLAGVGRNDEAAPLAERALAIRMRALGAEHPMVTATLQTLANIAWGQGDRETARTRYRELVTRTEGAGDPSQLANALDGLGQLERELGDVEAGDRHLAASLEAHARAGGTETVPYAMAEHNLASGEAGRGLCEQARPRLEHVVKVFRDSGLADNMLAYPQHAIATCELVAGRVKEAKALAEVALAGCGVDGCPPYIVGAIRATIAQARWLGGDRKGGAAALRAVRAELAAIPDAGPQVVELDAWMKQRAIQ